MSEPAAPIGHISDTARWVAMYRALESERPDAHFHDPFARRLAGHEGEEILRRMPRGRASAWPMVVRTCLFDEILLRLVAAGRVDRVLNLAAGLDARPWRLELPAALSWVDVDLPAILARKREELAGETPRCRYEAVTLDLREAPARRRLFAERCGADTRTLVVSEGLLVYLAPEEVAALADDLAAAPGTRAWLMDLASPGLLKLLARQWGTQVARGGAPFRFGPAEGTRFFEPHGWREVEYRSMWEEARRLRRQMPLAWFWEVLARFAPRARREEMRRFSGIVLLEHAAAARA